VIPRGSQRPESVAGPTRNGHAEVLGRVLELLATLPDEKRARPCVALSRFDEVALRDADARQLSLLALRVAASGSAHQWRECLSAQLRSRYDIIVVFDAATTRVE
jgi:hypothetical protein